MRSSRSRAPRRPNLARVPEKIVQQQIVDALRKVGATVYVLGRPGLRQRPCPACKAPIAVDPGTRQTPGIPDLLAFMPGRYRATTESVDVNPHQVWVECKAQGGRMSDEQVAFREHAQRAGVAHIVGGLDEVLAYLLQRGYVREIAHYRKATA